MESQPEYVLNPNTNRYVKKGTALHKRLLKSGAINQKDTFKPPALVVEKKVKAIADVKQLNRSEIDDIYHQLKAIREKKDAIEKRGRPLGKSPEVNKPTVKGLLKAKDIGKFNLLLKPSKPSVDTDLEFTDV